MLRINLILVVLSQRTTVLLMQKSHSSMRDRIHSKRRKLLGCKRINLMKKMMMEVKEELTVVRVVVIKDNEMEIMRSQQ
jgi:hypothetical protein